MSAEMRLKRINQSPSPRKEDRMIDLSFYKRGELSRYPIILKDAASITGTAQSWATLLLVALMSGVFVFLVWGGK